MMLTCSSGLSKAKTRTASPTFSSSSSLSVAVYSCTAFTWRRRTNPVRSGRNQRVLSGRWTHLVEEPWRKFSISAIGHRALEEEKSGRYRRTDCRKHEGGKSSEQKTEPVRSGGQEVWGQSGSPEVHLLLLLSQLYLLLVLLAPAARPLAGSALVPVRLAERLMCMSPLLGAGVLTFGRVGVVPAGLAAALVAAVVPATLGLLVCILLGQRLGAALVSLRQQGLGGKARGQRSKGGC